MSVRSRWAPLLLVPLGLGFGVLIAGFPDVTSEMRTGAREVQTSPLSTVASDETALLATTTTSATPPGANPTGSTGASGHALADLRAPGEVVVIVLNGAAIEGAAGALTEQIDALGYKTLSPSNTDERDSTVVQFREGYESEAAALATAIHPSVRTEPFDVSAPDDPGAAQLVVSIGHDYSDIRDAV